jgi:hypothetical protein
MFNEAERLYKDNPEDPEYDYHCHFQWLCMWKAWGEPPPPYHIDVHCTIFQSMNQTFGDLKEVAHEGGFRVVNTVTGSMPPMLHYNGDPTRGAFNIMAQRILEGSTNDIR